MGALFAKMRRLGRVKIWGVLMGLSYLGDGRQHSISVSEVVLNQGHGEHCPPPPPRAHLRGMPGDIFGCHYWREWCAPGILW